MYCAFCAKLKDYPIFVIRRAIAFGLPAITHVFTAARHNQVVHVTKKHIIALDRFATVKCSCKVYQLIFFNKTPVFLHLPIHLKTCHASVRIDVEPYMAEELIVLNFKKVLTTRVKI